jgi:hypothetical protein
VAVIDGEQKQIHAVNMKPGNRATTRQGGHSQGDLCRSRVRGGVTSFPFSRSNMKSCEVKL